jgi:hypothetical protein
VKQSVDHGFDDHPADDDDQARAAWVVSVRDDCDGCADLRIELTLEAEGASGTGVTAHLAPATARRLRAALARGLKDLGEDPG